MPKRPHRSAAQRGIIERRQAAKATGAALDASRSGKGCDCRCHQRGGAGTHPGEVCICRRARKRPSDA